MTNQELKREFNVRKLRLTTNRIAIMQCLANASSPLEIAQITEATGTIHASSIYRSVDALHNAKLINKVPFGMHYRYELGDTFQAHHHHVTCERCGHRVQIEDSKIENAVKKMTASSGFTHTKHIFELYGICQSCRRSTTEANGN